MYNLYDYDSLKTRSPQESSNNHFLLHDKSPSAEITLRNQLKIAKDQYEERIQSLSQEVRQIYNEISGDDLVQAMRENSVSKDYASHRAKEFIENSLFMEKEAFISNLQDLLLSSKTHIFTLEQKNKNLESQILALKEQIRAQEAKSKTHEAELDHLKTKIAEISLESEERFRAQEIKWLNTAEDLSRKEVRKVQDELNRLQDHRSYTELEAEKLRKDRETDSFKLDSLDRENSRMKEAITQLEERDVHWRKSYRELEYNNKELQKQYENLLGEFEAYKSRILNSEHEKEQLKLTCQSFQQQYEEEQTSHYETLQDLVGKYKVRSKKFKQKIIDQKKLITKLGKDQERLTRDMEERLSNISKEWARKCSDLERDGLEKDKNMMNKHKSDVQSLQTQYQQIMDHKLSDMQKDIELRIASSKSVDAEIIGILEKKVKEMHEKYVNRPFHEEEIKNEREKVMIDCNKEIERIKLDYSVRINQLENELHDYKMKYEQASRDLDTSIEKTTYIRSELTASSSKKEALEVEIMQLKAKLNEKGRNNKELLKQLVDACDTLEELKSLYSEECRSRQEGEREIQSLHRRIQSMAY